MPFTRRALRAVCLDGATVPLSCPPRRPAPAWSHTGGRGTLLPLSASPLFRRAPGHPSRAHMAPGSWLLAPSIEKLRSGMRAPSQRANGVPDVGLTHHSKAVWILRRGATRVREAWPDALAVQRRRTNNGAGARRTAVFPSCLPLRCAESMGEPWGEPWGVSQQRVPPCSFAELPRAIPAAHGGGRLCTLEQCACHCLRPSGQPPRRLAAGRVLRGQLQRLARHCQLRNVESTQVSACSRHGVTTSTPHLYTKSPVALAGQGPHLYATLLIALHTASTPQTYLLYSFLFITFSIGRPWLPPRPSSGRWKGRLASTRSSGTRRHQFPRWAARTSSSSVLLLFCSCCIGSDHV
jgi:hypothetical protein